jgi:Arc/MetJ family transcription regulator
MTLLLDDALVAEAMSLTGIHEPQELLHAALRTLIAREAGQRLAKLGGSASKASPGRRRRTPRSTSQ